MRATRAALVLIALSVGGRGEAQRASATRMPTWPAPTSTSRPWTRWWWLGSAVDSAGLTREIKDLADAGFGGVEVTSLYGARGYEAAYVPYLSRHWVALLSHAITEAGRRGMRVDLPLGSGWRTGGPRVPEADVNLSVRLVPTVQPGGETLFVAQPRFSGDSVKRPAPGGEGRAIDPFSATATLQWLQDFGDRLSSVPRGAVRSYFHDSFEYTGNWSASLFDEFARRRGYDLSGELRALAGRGDTTRMARVKSDYRETMDELLLEHFVQSVTKWSHARGSLMREQAHGSPGNLLDLYGLTDIPETESYGPLSGADANPLVMRFASSAAHVAGRRLASAESFTWLGEHFSTPLAEAKRAADRLFVAGVNHLVYHGTAYSPAQAAWPGWQFYASMELNPRNAIWRDVPALNAYVTRVQSMLQSSLPDNDVLLYWPIWDSWHDAAGMRMDFRVHNPTWLTGKPIGAAAHTLNDDGIGFDFVSDRQLSSRVRARGGRLTAGEARYRVLVIPSARHMPVSTLETILRLSRDGATIAFLGGLPPDVPGLGAIEQRRAALATLRASVVLDSAIGDVRSARMNRGRILAGDDLHALLAAAGVEREPLATLSGVQVTRSRRGDATQYFVVAGDSAVDAWVPMPASSNTVVSMDPMSGRIGVAESRVSAGRREMHLRLEPHESRMLLGERCRVNGTVWHDGIATGPAVPILGSWDVSFIGGGPALPSPFHPAAPAVGTGRGDADADRFAGTARYSGTFDTPRTATRFRLDLGRVLESARVRLNRRDIATLITAPFSVYVDSLRARGNVLEIEVTNLSANRIRDLDRRGVPWKIFRDINFVNIDYRSFDASSWPVRESGLAGPVTLTPLDR